MRLRSHAVILVFGLALWATASFAQSQPPKPAEAVQKIGPDQFAIGSIHVDTKKREVSAPGKVNAVTTVEFLASTKDGRKAYESALQIDAYAINFNAALLLIGLDTTHGRAPTYHFDKATPQGDPVEIWVEGSAKERHFRIRAEQLLFDRQKNGTVASGSRWVYTGSTFLKSMDGSPTPRFLAEEDGVLIGFVHSPAPLIEQVAGAGVSRYGAIVLNPNLGLTPDAPITLTVKAVELKGGKR